MTRRRLTVTYILVAVLGGGVVSAGNRGAARLRGQEYDIVLAGGHVLDPETGLDATRHVGIQGGRIAAVTTELPPRTATLEGSGAMVAPAPIRWSTRDWQKGHWAWASASRTHPARAARRSCTCSEWRRAAASSASSTCARAAGIRSRAAASAPCRRCSQTRPRLVRPCTWCT